MQENLPYIPLYFSDAAFAISSKFALPGYTDYESDTNPNVPYALYIKASG